MMEFTFNGIVRHSFGFYNPNHAAALICAIFPFLWTAWLKWKILPVRIVVAITSIFLLSALVFTFSRTGILVFCTEAILFCILQKKIPWKSIAVFGIVFAGILLFSGILGRFSIDRAITNRPEIWKAGIALFGANPFGVGLGNSGLLATNFLLSESIVCRTLINSHLTLLAEFGLIPAFLWFGIICYALFSGWRHPALWCSFLGLTLSASASTVFDWGILFSPIGYGGFSCLNFLLLWTLFLFYLLLAIMIGIQHPFQRKILFAAAGCSLLLLSVFFVFGRCVLADAPRLAGEFIIRKGKHISLVLYDESWKLKDVLPFLPDGYCIPLRSWEGETKIPEGRWDSIFLFGRSATSKFSNFPDSCEVIFVSPPDYIIFPTKLRKIFLKRFGEKNLLEQAKEHNLEIHYY